MIQNRPILPRYYLGGKSKQQKRKDCNRFPGYFIKNKPLISEEWVMIFMLLIFCNGSKQILQKDNCFDNINFEKEKYQNSSILFKNVLRLCEY